MSMQKLRGIRNTGAYTAQRSMLEHLLLIEEIILREAPNIDDIPTARTFFTRTLQQYKAQHQIHHPFAIQDIQHYLLSSTEQELNRKKSQIRGLYTSTLIQQAEGDEPITIDMKGKETDCLFYAINTPRHIIINNAKGDYTGAGSGSYQGQAHLTINNTKGDFTGEFAGSYQGQAHLTINNTKGDRTGSLAGYVGNAHLTINNTKGDRTGAWAGFDGNAIIVGYNNEGKEQFRDHEGIFVSYNPEETPKIERISNQQRKHILNLIAQNAPPEQIMAYLRGNT